MAISLNDGIQNNSPKSLDFKLLKNGTTAYASVSEANSTVNIAYRTVGLTVFVNGVEYWYKDGTADINLVIKNNVLQVNSDWTAGSGLAQILNKPSLSTVATTGAYADLTGKPTIPAQFNPIAGTNITISGSYPNITFNATGGGGGGGSTLGSVTYSANQAALIADLDKMVFINATSSSVTYTITPSTFTGRVLRIYGITTSNTISITPATGTIGGNPSYQLFGQECISVYSDGTNLFIITKN